MSITYNTIAGDTFDTVARKKYGTADGQLIRRANPAMSEPLSPGTTLVIPDQPAAPTNQPTGTLADNPDEVAIIVDGEAFRFWETVSVTRTIDQMDTFSLTAPSSRVFTPLSFSSVSVSVGGAPLFTGTLLNVQPTVDAGKLVDDVSGYSLPGVLNDCTMPASALDMLEFSGQTLREIASELLKPFGISAEFADDAGPVFDLVAIAESDKVLTFLASLATQRNLVIGSSPEGALVFSAPTGGTPVARLAQGIAPLTSVMPVFNPQKYYSDITGVEPVILGLAGQVHTVKNTRLSAVVRPYTYVVLDTTGGDLKTAVEAKAARMFAGAVVFSLGVATWRDANGNLWAPGSTIELDSEAAKVFGPYEFLIRSVTFRSSPAGRTATLDVVPPTAFTGKIPERMPWDE